MSGGFRKDKLWPFTFDERVKMRDRVAMPICRLLPAVRDVQVLNTRPATGFGVGEIRHMWRELVQACRAGVRPLRMLAVPDPNLVTITLRECEHWPERNSNVPVWLRAGAEIAREFGKRVVFVRDTLQAGCALPGAFVHTMASMHIPIRAGLYRSAYCNLFVSNGPAWLSIALDAPTMIFKPVTERSSPVSSAKFFEHCGVKRGGQLPGAPSYQRLVWSNDNEIEPIVNAFRQFAKDH